MDLAKINDLANEIQVSRLLIHDREQKIADLISANAEIQTLQAELADLTSTRDARQGELLAIMSENQLKSWKTEQAVFSRAKRVTATIDPAVKKNIEVRLKQGDQVEGWSLQEKEYISIRLNPKT